MANRRRNDNCRKLGAAFVGALCLAGCGGGATDRRAPTRPKLPAALANQLAERSDRVAAALTASDLCGARGEATALQHATVQAINARQVPAALQEDLTGTVNDLVDRIQCVSAPQQDGDEDEHGDGRGKGKGKGKKGKD